MEEKLNKIIVSLAGSSNFNEDTELSTIGIDSLKTMELLIMVEEAFGVEIEESHLKPENFKSLASVLSLLRTVIK